MKPHEYVLIKERKNAGDVRYINNASLKIGKDGQQSVSLGDVQFATVERMVRGWNITVTRQRPDGSTVELPLPYDPNRKAACIEELDGDYFDFIFQEIAARNPPMSAEQQQAFPTPATNGAADNLSVSLMPSSGEK